jgi:hypothetical protein
MSSVLFLFVIQAFLDTLKLQAQPVQYAFFPKNKNGNLATIKGRLLSQNTSAKGTPFLFNSSFYVDDSFFLFATRQELQQAIEDIDQHFTPTSKKRRRKQCPPRRHHPKQRKKSPLHQQI